MRFLAEETRSAKVLINLQPSNSYGEIMHLWLSFFCSYSDKPSRYDGAFNYSAWAAMRCNYASGIFPTRMSYSMFKLSKLERI